jgi:hypothetical protein
MKGFQADGFELVGKFGDFGFVFDRREGIGLRRRRTVRIDAMRAMDVKQRLAWS